MKKAFTLIELLVVIAIIAILAAILFPVFAQAKAAAKASANLSNLKQVGLGHLQYSADSDDVFPLAVRYELNAANQAQGFGVTAMNSATSPGFAVPWTEAIFPYTKNRDIYTSPLASTAGGVGTDKAFRQAQYFGVVPTALAINNVRAASASGVYNLPGPVQLGNNAQIDGLFGFGDADTGRSAPSKSQTAVDHLSDVIMVSDAGAYDMGFLGKVSAAPAAGTSGALVFDAYTPSPWSGKIMVGPWSRKGVSGAWNGGSTNAAYTVGAWKGQTQFCAADGSAKSVPIEKVYEKRSIGDTANTPAIYRMYSNTTL